MLIHHPDNIKNLCCIYIYRFNDGSFYIGKTTDLSQRLCTYKSLFTKGRQLSKKILGKLEIFDEVTFDILEVVEDATTLKDRETFHVRSNLKDSNMLNSRKFFL